MTSLQAFFAFAAVNPYRDTRDTYLTVRPLLRVDKALCDLAADPKIYDVLSRRQLEFGMAELSIVYGRERAIAPFEFDPSPPMEEDLRSKREGCDCGVTADARAYLRERPRREDLSLDDEFLPDPRDMFLGELTPQQAESRILPAVSPYAISEDGTRVRLDQCYGEKQQMIVGAVHQPQSHIACAVRVDHYANRKSKDGNDEPVLIGGLNIVFIPPYDPMSASARRAERSTKK